MAYRLYDADGYVANLASITGYDDLLQFIEKFSDVPTLKSFIDEGMTDFPQQAADELKKILPRCSDTTVASTIRNLIVSFNKAKEIAIVSE